MAAAVDYAGLANTCFGNAFGTSTNGMITERALANGQAEVTVLLFTKNALTWVMQGADLKTAWWSSGIAGEYDLADLRAERDSSRAGQLFPANKVH